MPVCFLWAASASVSVHLFYAWGLFEFCFCKLESEGFICIPEFFCYTHAARVIFLLFTMTVCCLTSCFLSLFSSVNCKEVCTNPLTRCMLPSARGRSLPNSAFFSFCSFFACKLGQGKDSDWMLGCSSCPVM